MFQYKSYFIYSLLPWESDFFQKNVTLSQNLPVVALNNTMYN